MNHSAPPRPEHPTVRVIDCHVARLLEREGSTKPDLEFLVLHRAAGRMYEGTWRMVGGKMQAGESAWQTCLRELLEETGLVPKRLLSVPYVNQFYEWKHDRINAIPVFVALVSGEPTLDGEHDTFAWLSPSEACVKLAWPGQKEGLLIAAELLLHNDSLQEFMEIPLPGNEART